MMYPSLRSKISKFMATFYLNKNENLIMPANNINFSRSAAPIPINKAVTFLLEIARSDGLAVRSQLFISEFCFDKQFFNYRFQRIRERHEMSFDELDTAQCIQA